MSDLKKREHLLVIVSAILLSVVAIAIWFYLLHQGGMQRQRVIDTAAAMTSGDASRGRYLIKAYGCAGCHEIPRIEEAAGKIGPPLDSFKDRGTIAGVMANSVPNLVLWLQHPRAVDPKTAMPDLGVGEQDARDIAAYLFTE
jgi:cytochrome c